MFPFSIGTVLWLPVAVALLKDQLTIHEQFSYTLTEGLRLEEFRADLQAMQVENPGSVICVQIPVDLIALFGATSSLPRQTFKRRECIIRRFPLSAFRFAEEDGQPIKPEAWQGTSAHFHYCPDFSGSTLTIKLEFSLQLCATQNRLVDLSELFSSSPMPVSQPAIAPSPLLPAMQQELENCKQELTTLKKQLAANPPSPSEDRTHKAVVGKKIRQYRTF